jgi:hypothetical protein
MEIGKEYMLASSFWTLGSYLVLPDKVMVSFLSKLSELYSTHLRIMGQEMSKEPEFGYEASQTGIEKQQRRIGEA